MMQYSNYALPRGDSLSVQSNDVSATAWKDNKVVMSMYAGYSPLDQTVVKRTQKTGTDMDVPCPMAIAMYNRHMGGVDRGDQLRGYYHRHNKSRKFYR